MKKIAILGSTGSIGSQTLEVARENGDIEITGLAAGSNITLLEEQIREFSPKLAAVWSEEKAQELRVRVADTDTRIVSGMDGLLQVSTLEDTEILVTAVVGMIGIRPTIEAIKAGKDIALANKETLVTAGHIIMPLAREKQVSILPVDSEHSAIFQSLQGNESKAVHKILLTASGGPFRGKKEEELMEIRVEDALKHPNWTMGQKITIDSATMVNKGLEVIEAKWLFDMDTFYGLRLAYEAGKAGGSLPTVFNAANELAVSMFLKREVKFLEIVEIIEDCMRAHHNIENPDLQQILDVEAATYDRIRSRR